MKNHTDKTTELFETARNYEFGNGVEVDMTKAARYYLEAAKAGHPDAMCHTGYLMLFGYGMERSTREAIKWLESGVTAGASSPYRKNAEGLLKKVHAAPYPFHHEDARLPAFYESLSDYNKFARKHGYETLSFSDGRLRGIAVDGESTHYANKKERDHYLRYATVDGSGIKRGCWKSFKQDFQIGYLGSAFFSLLKEMLVLGID